ncbi:hypothetical protein Cni_G22816 [Canna indica]|uniref:Uncharacterized protein n=1 Tax=Canna indica TaxID=4628 RepID=A0AAQ3KXD4_9LILI|nr:hypothetical protein Cni_G22816 [Canna indica]
MGRRIPIPPQVLHPSLSIFLLVAWVAAAVTVVLSLCATCHRRSSRKPSPDSPASPPNESVAKPASVDAAAPTSEQHDEKPADQGADVEPVTVIEIAPDAVATHGPLPPTMLPPSASTKRKMSMSFGKGLPDKLRMSRRERKGESEDTIWKKTIILGEKCKVASDEEEEEVVVVDEKGNRQRYYHPRTPKSRQASRNNSFFYPDETPSS